ncbi:histidine phosphatase superfamily [Protomyces lactucae-debilis]|uniref:Histidine phosphatase superfamily n=1 Tax=Protomyces lactucae-debilis TaxID=2754530 RepID=A0A1Y2ESS1_PROLT|nr:histidine phosphatase superfamily [Protomyces lactucae-debilis]ORY74618.1 histidine phosphatase superfamily [Protomyces lactucae-debilis]
MTWQSYAIAGASFTLVAYLLLINSLFQTPGSGVFRKADLFPIDIGYKGPTATGLPASLRQTSPKNGQMGPFVSRYKVEGQAENETIEHYWGSLSPYFVSDEGFGHEERALPDQCKIKQAQILSRHGSRYPTAGSWLKKDFAEKLKHAKFEASGPLAMLNDWQYTLGEAILVPIGKQQLYDSGVLAAMQYGNLLFASNKKLVFRTTSQARMTESALAFLEGAYGGGAWKDHVNLELIIEWPSFNNTLAPYYNCPKSVTDTTGTRNRRKWEEIYLANRTEYLSQYIKGIAWTLADTVALQTLCAYETNALGYSDFCELFTMQEFRDFDYGESIWFQQSTGFGAATGRAQGIGWVNEMLRRIEKSPLDLTTLSSENTTLDGSKVFFPIDQAIYVDFTHDSVIAAVLTALDFEQFSAWLPSTGPQDSNERWSTSRLTPFAARLVVELIECDDGEYIHFMLNGQTVSLKQDKYGKGRSEGDGWHRLASYLEGMSDRNKRADWQRACYEDSPVRERTDGEP